MIRVAIHPEANDEKQKSDQQPDEPPPQTLLRTGRPLLVHPVQIGLIGGRRHQLEFGHDRFFVQADIFGVGANETSREDAARKLFKLIGFQSLKGPQADFGGIRDLAKRDPPHFAFSPKIFAKSRHGIT